MRTAPTEYKTLRDRPRGRSFRCSVALRNSARIVLAICLLGWMAAPLQGQDAAGVIHALEQRYRALDRLRVEYEWHEDKAPIRADPFDSKNWLRDPKLSLNRTYRVLIVRPEFRVEIEEPNRPTIVTNWLNGERVSKAKQRDGSWAVEINDNRWSATGPLPFLTPLELHQTFDVQSGLLELLRDGRLVVVPGSGEFVDVRGGPIEEKAPWNVRARFDPSRGMLPIVVAAEVTIPETTITWEMRTVGAQPLNGAYAIEEAIIALENRGQKSGMWQIFHFHATRLEHVPHLSRKDMEISVPDRNASIIDEVRLFYRKLDANGQVIHQEKWTKEQRQADLAFVHEASQKHHAAQASIRQRTRTFTWLVAAAALVAVSLLGVWTWTRRRQTA